MTDRLDDLAPVIEREPVPVVPAVAVDEDTSRIVSISQQKLDKLISSAMGRSAAQTRAELATANQTINDLQVQLRAANPDSTVADRLNAELLVAKAEITSIKASAAAQSIASHPEQLAASNGFIDPQLTRTILTGQVQRNADGTYKVLDSSGAVRVNADNTPLTVEQLVQETAASKPFLIRGTVKSGGGGSSSTGHAFASNPYTVENLWGPGARPDAGKVLNEWSLRDRRGYDQARASAKAKGLV